MENSVISVFIELLMVLHIFTSFPYASSSLSSSCSSTNNNSDLLALLNFKSHIEKELLPNSSVVSSWNTNTSFCNWIGVYCGQRHKRVTALNLSYMELQGTISPHIGNLSFLRVLNLCNNSFYGPIPETVGRLRRLRVINLIFNQLHGTIPSSISHCKRLQRILLGQNHFEGNIPESLGNLTSLEILQLQDINLTEFGSQGRVSPKGDVYSFGIMLMEIFTRKNPRDEMFVEGLNLRQWVLSSYCDRVMDIADSSFWINGIEEAKMTLLIMDSLKGILSSIMELALECSEDLPEERLNMIDVTIRLKKIKNQILQDQVRFNNQPYIVI